MRPRSDPRVGNRRSWLAVSVTACISLAALLAMSQPRSRMEMVRALPWTKDGVWLKADTHTHTRFSDGSPIDQVVANAVGHGCDVLAITDHSDHDLTALTPEYFAALDSMRRQFPSLLLLGGFEWNVPPGKGGDHVTVLLPPRMEDPAALLEFKTRFDDLNKEGENPELAAEALSWLKRQAAGLSPAPVLFLNHPNRSAPTREHAPLLFRALRDADTAIVGFEGGPGHQKAKRIGSYSGAIALTDRWDTLVAEVGGAWDQLLGEGTDVSGALATSDFHGPTDGDFWPCEFSETWLLAPERSAAGVLLALHAGSFVGVHGRIARAVRLSIAAEGLERPAAVGESARIPPGTPIAVELRFETPDRDYAGAPNRIDQVEIIQIDRDGARVAWSGAPDATGPQARLATTVPAGGAAFRARGRRDVPDGPDLLFYTNAVRVVN